MIRFNRQKNKFYFDHSELLADPAIHAIVGKPRFRSQQPAAPTMPAAPVEDPAQRFNRLVQELMEVGKSFVEAVAQIEKAFPTLRERSNELQTARQEVARAKRLEAKAQWRAEASRRFKARKAGR